MTCRVCGAELESGVVLCGTCGARVLPQWEAEATGPTITVSRPSLGRATAPLAPPPAAARVDGGRPPIVTAAAVAAASDGGSGATVALVSGWDVLLPDGVRIEASGPLILGRRPKGAADAPGARLVPVPDPEGTVSRSHLLVEPIGGMLRLTNLSSKNTVPVAWPNGVRYSIVPGEGLVVSSLCAARLGRVPVLLQRS